MAFRFYTDPARPGRRLSRRRPRRGVGDLAAARRGARHGARQPAAALPGIDADHGPLNLRAGHPEFADPKVRTALLQGIDRAAIIDGAYAKSAATATGLDPGGVALVRPGRGPARCRSTAGGRSQGAQGRRVDQEGRRLVPARTPRSRSASSCSARRWAPTRGCIAAAAGVAADWTALGLAVEHVALPPGEFVTDHLATGDFQVAVVDVHHRPRSGPLSAARLEPDADRWVERRRAPGARPSTTCCARPARPARRSERKAAYSALQKQLASRSLPAAADLRRRGRGRSRHARGTPRPPGHRSVGPILGCANMAPRRRPVTVGGVRAEVAE